MPSAAIAKVESKTTTNPEGHPHELPPLRQVLVLIEHKIRNLEKRKGRLDSYKDIQKSGKDLTPDQLVAASKYDEVIQLLEFAREFVKQIQTILAVTEKDQRRTARRELALKTQQDTGKFREVLIIQNTLEQLNNEVVRQDFMDGTNGAIKLTDDEFELLDKLYYDITPKRVEGAEGSRFTAHAQKAAEHMLNVVDGRVKVYHEETTYEKVKTIIQNINSSEYFDKKVIEGETAKELNGDINDVEGCTTAINNENELDLENQTHENIDSYDDTKLQEVIVTDSSINVKDNIEGNITIAPAPASVPAPSFPPTIVSVDPTQTIQVPSQIALQQIVSSPVPQVVGAPIPVPSNQMAHMGPTTVRAVEQVYFKQHQYIQQMRPITEVIGTGSFYFLQDSELDSPDQFPNVGFQQTVLTNIQHSPTNHPQQPKPHPQQPIVQQQLPNKSQQIVSGISTQTFTNQNFQPVSQPAVYPQIKPAEINQPHIPGFATASSTIPVAITPAGPILQAQPQNSVHILAPAPAAVPIPGFVSPQQFSQQIIQNPHEPLQHTKEHIVTVQKEVINSQIEHIPSDQLPKIENWNNNNVHINSKQDISHQDNSSEWRDSQNHTGDDREDSENSKEWHSNDKRHHNESNTWSNDQINHDNNYGGNNRGYQQRSRGGSSGPGSMQRNNNGRSSASNPNSSNTNYHARPNNNYQSNNSNTGRSSGGGGSGTFFRNNDYYQVQNGTSGNYISNNRQDSSYSTNMTYKSRGHPNATNLRGGSHLRNNASNNLTDRNPRLSTGGGNNSNINNRAAGINTNNNGGTNNNVKPIRGGGGSYNNSPRNVGNSRTSQGVNV